MRSEFHTTCGMYFCFFQAFIFILKNSDIYLGFSIFPNGLHQPQREKKRVKSQCNFDQIAHIVD